MHSVIYRTKMLRDCGLELPKHTFYVDNIFVYHPLPHVKKMYYLDVNFYRYYIGRVDQSVNEAEKKMVEINEAYDMLSNPEKYQNRTTSQRNTSQTYGNQSYQRNPYENTSNQGMEREYGEFWGFDFEDLFGFGTRNQSSYKQNYQATDTEQFRQIVDFINMKQYDYANQILQKVVSSERSARWYYLSALTNQGLGNQIRAMEDIKCALQMEPDNVSYKQLYGELNRSSSTYQDVGKEFQKAAEGMHKYCMGFCMLNFFCTFCRC